MLSPTVTWNWHRLAVALLIASGPGVTKMRIPLSTIMARKPKKLRPAAVFAEFGSRMREMINTGMFINKSSVAILMYESYAGAMAS